MGIVIPTTTSVPPAIWRAEVGAALSAGHRLLDLYSTPNHGLRAMVLATSGQLTVFMTEAPSGVETLVDLAPCAQWPEREAHDLHGVRFDGHEPLRPLLMHTGEWRVPVRGPGVHEVAVGPIHAGVIESGHFRFHAVGERIILLDLRLFYKHRGLEAAATRAGLAAGAALAQRACATCAVANSIAYAQAAETLAGLSPTPGIRRARTALLEMERMYNHLNDLSAACAGVGFAAGTMAFAALKERAQRLNLRCFGHRFLFGAAGFGGSPAALGAGAAGAVIEEIDAILADAESCWRETLFNGSVQDRFAGVGVLTNAAARRLDAVGPAARAAGLARDVRAEPDPSLAYEGFSPSSPAHPTGDVAARVEVRMRELRATAELLRDLLKDGLEPEDCRHSGLPDGAGSPAVGRVESARGESVCCLEVASGRITRLRLRTSSYRNWPVLAEVVPGNLLPDFPLINKSFELCYACVDR